MDKYSKIRYNTAPTIGHPRTRFDLSHDILTTCNNGEFVPILTEFINPGETAELSFASLSRLETSLHQTMDNAYVEFAYFFTPLRILWTDFEKFEGANDDPWAQLTIYQIPQISLTGGSGSSNISPGSLYNHLALPSGSYGSGSGNASLSIEALSLRNVFEIYNQWYRNENYDSIIYYSKGSGNVSSSQSFLFNGNQFYPNSQNLYVNRFRDRFSTLLPAPQKGQEVQFGIAGEAPIMAYPTTGGALLNGVHDMGAGVKLLNSATGSPATDFIYEAHGAMTNGAAQLDTTGRSEIRASNLYADLSAATAVTVNQLRLAIVRQAMLERDARAGTRYHEIISSRWDIHARSLELDRPELLGGKRIPLSMMEVLQTSETGTTVLGSDAGHSKTVDKSHAFVKSFTQHGIIQGFMYFRTARSYSQGIDRMHFIKDYLDMPDPMLDKTGETSVFRKEMYALKTSTPADVDISNQVAGYQEQYYWIKERVNRFSGFFQPSITGTLDSWHYGDDYTTFPLISASWMKEGSSNVDRTIAVQSNAAFQYSVNIHFEFFVTRPFAKYNIPNTFGF